MIMAGKLHIVIEYLSKLYCNKLLVARKVRFVAVVCDGRFMGGAVSGLWV